MTTTLAMVTFLVRDYDEAIRWFVDVLGFSLIEDTALSPSKRWVVVQAPGGGVRLLLAQAANDLQAASIGGQAGGRVGFFLETDDFAADFARLTGAGVRFLETPRQEAYGQVCVFEDLYGNRWDLIQVR